MYIGVFVLFFVSCKQKYEMYNMILQKNIDVTSYIRSGEFVPDSCEGRLDRLMKKKPMILDESYEDKLQAKLLKWRIGYNKWLREKGEDTISLTVDKIVDKTSYQYSYFMTNHPVDVYRTNLGIDLAGYKDFKLYIRAYQNGKIHADYYESGWIINNCDSINSIQSVIYGR